MTRSSEVDTPRVILKKLGKNQKGCLASLLRRGETSFWPSGWVWDTASNTDRIMQSLAKRGLVVALKETSFGGYGQYRLSKLGIAVADRIENPLRYLDETKTDLPDEAVARLKAERGEV